MFYALEATADPDFRMSRSVVVDLDGGADDEMALLALLGAEHTNV